MGVAVHHGDERRLPWQQELALMLLVEDWAPLSAQGWAYSAQRSCTVASVDTQPAEARRAWGLLHVTIA